MRIKKRIVQRILYGPTTSAVLAFWVFEFLDNLTFATSECLFASLYIITCRFSVKLSVDWGTDSTHAWRPALDMLSF